MSDWSFMSQIASGLKRSNRGDPRWPTLWPSEATVVDSDGNVQGRCRRATFFRYAAARQAWEPYLSEQQKDLVDLWQSLKKPHSDYTLFVFKQGDLYEDFLIEMSKNVGVFVATQTPVYIKSANVSGKIDIEAINPETGKLSIVEAKSVHGFGGTKTIGKAATGKYAGKAGEPKESHLMQLGTYHYWVAQADESYEESRLVYGDRGTGQHAEFLVWTEPKESGTEIWYRQTLPYQGQATCVKFTIEDMLDQFQLTHKRTSDFEVPDRDFDLQYSYEKMVAAYNSGDLPKVAKVQMEKIFARQSENESRVAEGKKPLADLTLPKRGDWQCSYCDGQKFCYEYDGTPKPLPEWVSLGNPSKAPKPKAEMIPYGGDIDLSEIF
jgi:hypothetical protein